MPWQESNVVNERIKFCLEWRRRWDEAEGGRVDVAELCRVAGVSRQRGYVWLRRYRAAGFDLRVLEDRSRRPHRSPSAVPEPMQDFIVAARKKHPRWGPRKLRAWLVRLYPGREFPSASAMAAILKRRGMTTPRRRRRRRVPAVPQPFAEATGPNSVWCIDFKGKFKTGDGRWCLPFTVTDAFSRYCVRAESVDDGTGDEVQHILDSAFREFGLPAAIRSDNGPPFAAPGPAGLTRFAAWLLRLDIRLERITPGEPQENGRHERFHRTLLDEAASPARANGRAQQRAFDLFRREYNEERPHEALGDETPASIYVPSSRRYPTSLLAPSSSSGFGHLERLDKNGVLLWRKRRIFVSTAIASEYVALEPDRDTCWVVLFGSIVIGHIDDEHLDRGMVPAPRPRKAHVLKYRAD
jgi:transposase InsO family protein